MCHTENAKAECFSKEIPMNWLTSFLKRRRESPEKGEEIPVESISNFTPRAREALSFAKSEAARFNHDSIDIDHLFLGVMKLGRGIAFNVLQRMEVQPETVRVEVEKQIGSASGQGTQGPAPFTPRAKKALILAQKEAKALNHNYIGTEHILLGLMLEGDSVTGRVLNSLGINVKAMRTEILKEFDPKSLSGGIE